MKQKTTIKMRMILIETLLQKYSKNSKNCV